MPPAPPPPPGVDGTPVEEECRLLGVLLFSENRAVGGGEGGRYGQALYHAVGFHPFDEALDVWSHLPHCFRALPFDPFPVGGDMPILNLGGDGDSTSLAQSSLCCARGEGGPFLVVRGGG